FVRKPRQRALLFRQRLHGRLELPLQLVTTFEQVLLLSEHSRERRARRLLRVPARLDFDCELVGDLAMLLGTRPRLGDDGRVALALRFELLPDAGKLVEHASGLLASRDALGELRIEPLALGRKLRNRVIESARTAA